MHGNQPKVIKADNHLAYNWDSPPDTTKHRLLSLLQNLQNTEEKLIAKREEAKTKRKESDIEWQKLLENNANLKSIVSESYEDISKHISYAIKTYSKINLEKQSLDELQQKINKNKIEIICYQEVKDEMVKTIQKYEKFFNFLSTVAEFSNEFRSIGDIIKRFELIEDVRQQLHTETVEIIAFQEHGQQQLKILSSEKSEELQNFHNKLIELETRAKDVQANASYWQSIKQKVKNIITAKTITLSAFNQGVEELYVNCCNATDTRPNLSEHTNEQITFIKNTIQYYQEVYRRAIIQSKGCVSSMKKKRSGVNFVEPGD